MMFFAKIGLSAIIGIDLGSSEVVYSIAHGEIPLHVPTNVNSQKFFPNYFTFWNRTKASNYSSTETWNNATIEEFEWSFGQTAFDHCINFPNNCISGNVFALKSYSNLTGIEITALSLLSSISSVISSEGVKEKVTAVIAIPPKTTPREKSFLYAACNIAGIEAVQFVDATNAATEYYALEKTSRFANSTKVIAIADIGLNGVRVSIFEFDGRKELPSVTQLAVACNETIGGAYIDKRLSEVVAEEYNISLEDTATRIQWVNDMKVAKEMLAIHDSVDLKWDLEDHDEIVLIQVNRTTLNSVVSELNATLQSVVDDALRQAHNPHVDYVEIIGGGTRMKWVQAELQRRFDVKKCSRTMDASQAVAMGAGYIAAERSPEFQLKNVTRSFLLTSFSTARIGNKRYKIFTPGDEEDSAPEIETFIKPNESISIFDEYNHEYARFRIDVPTEMKILVSFIHNYYLMPVPYQAVTSDGREFEVIMENVGWEVPPDELRNMAVRVGMLVNTTNLHRQREKAANEFETLLFKIKAIANQYETELGRNHAVIKKAVDENIHWCENFSEAATVDLYANKLLAFNETVNPILDELEETTLKPAAVNKFERTIGKASILSQEGKLGGAKDELIDNLTIAASTARIWVNQYNTNSQASTRDQINKARLELKKAMIEVRKNLRALHPPPKANETESNIDEL